jgi:UDP-N-acetyl-D-glucosamine/UDP-N-acetyl-D-galactosamine dehydrogenase
MCCAFRAGKGVPDIRNSKVIDIVPALEASDARVQVHDPMATPEMAKQEYGLALTPLDALQPADAVVLAVAHRDYVREGWPLVTRLLKGRAGIVLDGKSRLDRAQRPEGIELWRL